MWYGVLKVVSFKIHFLTCYSFDHNKISMTYANLDALYAGSLRINVAYVFFEYFYILHLEVESNASTSALLLSEIDNMKSLS